MKRAATLALVLTALLLTVHTGPHASAEPADAVMKHQRAIFFHGGPLEKPILVDDREKAIRTAIALGYWLGELPLTEATGRHCVGQLSVRKENPG